jgi:hypothetical protein
MAVRNALAMESQNMAQEAIDRPKAPREPAVSIQSQHNTFVQVVEDEDWYHNSAHQKAREREAEMQLNQESSCSSSAPSQE